MSKGRKRGLGSLLLAGTVALLAIGLLGGSATAAKDKGVAKVRMELDGKSLFFAGADSVNSGDRLKVVNDTNPKQVGPHTFTLMKKKFLPDTKQQRKNCGRLKGICGKVAKAHEVDMQTFEVNRPVVDEGAMGWDKQFTKKADGDSWYTETKNETHSRTVEAKPGSTLYYLCVVHPEMQGSLKVTR